MAGGPADHQHGRRDHLSGQSKLLTHLLAVFQNVADVAAAQSQALGGHHHVLSGNAGIRHRQEKITRAGRPGLTARLLIHLGPAGTVRQENQHHRGGGDEGLMVAQVGQPGLALRVRDIQNGIQLLAACGGGLERCLQQLLLHCRGNGLIQKDTHALAVLNALLGGIHGDASFCSGPVRPCFFLIIASSGAKITPYPARWYNHIFRSSERLTFLV